MSATKHSTEFILKSHISFKDKVILTLGNPFLYPVRSKNAGLKDELHKKLFDCSKNQRFKYFMEKIMQCRRLDILDISDTEEANIIHNLNLPIEDINLMNKYDVIFDFGTMEHVFNNIVHLQNIFKMLKKNGLFILDLPANGWLEHGFRQYSPTFFYDLCYQNNKSLRLLHLSLVHNKLDYGVDVLPYYSNDEEASKCIDTDSSKFRSFAKNFDKNTHRAVSVINKISGPSMVFGVIKKLENVDLKFNIIQRMYRKDTINTFSNKKIIHKNHRLKKIFKSLILLLIQMLPLRLFVSRKD